MIVLALDTALAACQCALVDGRSVLASASEPMVRGHQERLAGMVGEVVADAGLALTAIDQIAVTVGPGSFTGLRVGLAFAKGLALALSRPLAGIGTLEALAATASAPGLRAAVIDAGRGHVFLQTFEDARPTEDPVVFPLDEGADWLRSLFSERRATLVGPGAGLLAEALANVDLGPIGFPDPGVIARLALESGRAGPPTPLYLRAADAKRRTP